MAALDQAFIRAYKHQGAAAPSLATPPEPVATMPLSSFSSRLFGGAEESAATATIETAGPLRPMLQVDRFTWPAICRRLSESATDELERLADGLLAATQRGHKVLAVAGAARGEGATTLMICAAGCLARRGLRVVMVDADLAHPDLASRLGLSPEVGWEDLLCGRLPLEEVLIESVNDRLTLLPLRGPLAVTDEPNRDNSRLTEGLDRLASGYDLVLVDPGPLEDLDAVCGPLARIVTARLDAIALVHNVRVTAVDQLADVERYLATAGIPLVGIIENFVPGSTIGCTNPTGS